MKIERSQVTKLLISGAPGLDPVHVFLEDIEPRRGRITITCFTTSWTAYWGGMGERAVGQFFADCSVEYLAGCLSSVKQTTFDPDAFCDIARAAILRMRRNLEIDADEARELYDEADRHIDNPADEAKLMHRIFGDEWWCQLPKKANPDYVYLCHIIRAVRQALSLDTGSVEEPLHQEPAENEAA